MTILEQVQAAVVGTVAVDIQFNDPYYSIKVDYDCWRSSERTDDDDAFTAGAGHTQGGWRLYLIPPDALAQFEVKE